MKEDPAFDLVQSIQVETDKRSYRRSETYARVEQSRSFLDLLKRTPVAQEITPRVDKRNSMKIQKIVHREGNSILKRQSTEQEKNFANSTSGWRLISQVYKTMNIKQTVIQSINRPVN